MKLFVKLFFFLSAATVAAAVPFRASTALEKKLESAKAEYYRNYDQLEAHFKFAGVLYDAGCLESAFCNAETLLKNKDELSQICDCIFVGTPADGCPSCCGRRTFDTQGPLRAADCRPYRIIYF